MGQQTRKVIKRRRRANYLKRKQEQAKLGGIAQKKSAPKKGTESKAALPKKTAAAKKAAKKAPAKKVAKKAPGIDETEVIVDAPQTTVPAAMDAEQVEAVEAVATGTAEVIDEIQAEAPQPAAEEVTEEVIEEAPAEAAEETAAEETPAEGESTEG
jgi:hypothetical protein